MKLRITVEGKPYDVEVEVLEDLAPESAENEAEVSAPSPQRPLAPKSKPIGFTRPRRGEKHDEKICRSSLAGLVIAVVASVGQSVAKNDPLVVIEAMKMETKVLSPGAGVIKAVKVGAGDPVKPGQILVELD